MMPSSCLQGFLHMLLKHQIINPLHVGALSMKVL